MLRMLARASWRCEVPVVGNVKLNGFVEKI